LAGSTNSGYVDESRTFAAFYYPEGVAVDGSGNVYVADSGNNMIRKIDTNGYVTTFAGSTNSGFVDGNGTNAAFQFPSGLAVDGSGNVYVADHANNVVRKISASGNVTTLADCFGAQGICVDRSGNVYVTGSDASTVLKIDSSGTVTTLAGGQHGYQDGVGTNTAFNWPNGIAVDNLGNIYVADTFNNVVRILKPGN
jgi:sugar lactone lactonase YvrE